MKRTSVREYLETQRLSVVSGETPLRAALGSSDLRTPSPSPGDAARLPADSGESIPHGKEASE